MRILVEAGNNHKIFDELNKVEIAAFIREKLNAVTALTPVNIKISAINIITAKDVKPDLSFIDKLEDTDFSLRECPKCRGAFYGDGPEHEC